jgi:hypothetical protein
MKADASKAARTIKHRTGATLERGNSRTGAACSVLVIGTALLACHLTLSLPETPIGDKLDFSLCL